MFGDDAGERRGGDEPVVGNPDGRGDHVGQRPRAVPFQREGEPGDGAGYGGGGVAGVGRASGERGGRRRRRSIVDHHGLPGGRHVDQHHAFAAEPAGVRLGRAHGKGRGDGGVDGVPARAQHRDAGVRRQGVRGGDDAARRRDGGARRGDAGG